MRDAFVKAFKRRACEGEAYALDIPINPVPASRPRVGRWGVHYLKTYATWMKQIACMLPTRDEPHFAEGPVAVLAEFILKRPQRLTRAYPRGDTDNYEKALYDALTKCGCIWKDDDQIVMALTFKRYAEPNEKPRIKVMVMGL